MPSERTIEILKSAEALMVKYRCEEELISFQELAHRMKCRVEVVPSTKAWLRKLGFYKDRIFVHHGGSSIDNFRFNFAKGIAEFHLKTKNQDEILLFALVLMLPEKAIVTLFDDCGYSVRRLAKLSGLSEKMVMKRLQKRIPKDDKGIQCETKSNLGYATSRRRGVGAV